MPRVKGPQEKRCDERINIPVTAAFKERFEKIVPSTQYTAAYARLLLEQAIEREERKRGARP